MNICLPVECLNGLESQISPNLRSAPALLMVDSENGSLSGIDTTSGVCGAIPSDIDAIVCAGGMGRGMFKGLQLRGVRVFNSAALTVAEALADLASGKLEEVGEVACCSGGEEHHHQGEKEGCGCGNHAVQNEHESRGCGCSH